METITIKTPLIKYLTKPEEKIENNIFLKCENLQPFGSYKIRGIENLIKNLSKDQLKNGLIAASAGNMGQAVAFLARTHNIECTIIAPESAPKNKLDKIRQLGANLILLPYKDVWDIVIKGSYPLSSAYYIHPANDDLLTDGYQSIAKDIMEQNPDTNIVIIPYGVGGLTKGVCQYLKLHHPKVKTYSVEPTTSSPLKRYLLEGNKSSIAVTPSIVDAIGTPEVIPSMQKIVHELIDYPLTVSINSVARSISSIYKRHFMVSEGAGAASLAAALELKEAGKNIVCIITGANIDQEIIQRILK